MTIDEVLGLSMPQLGYQFYDTLVDGFNFADDWVVCAEGQARLIEKLKAAAVELGRAGMKMNARKTKMMLICGDGKLGMTAVLVESFCFAGEIIITPGPTDTYDLTIRHAPWKEIHPAEWLSRQKTRDEAPIIMLDANSLVVELDPGMLAQLKRQDPVLRKVAAALLDGKSFEKGGIDHEL
ncbi:hypothetical protein T265_07948 [Opisthorchis viverrini]|uniref:Reverse transcriptase domain-containing protein n=1 Tax=Opisthorchis viverrini TaxID=6198 RepID=A0A074ZFH7_OPIVI|nr:hypothetical protein T265_07948 [Opisthorchis viverrini]KER24392.1 hypothetical protein T265_07948 [Opisthorchis viverrini]